MTTPRTGRPGRRAAALAAVALLGSLGLAACSGAADDADEGPDEGRSAPTTPTQDPRDPDRDATTPPDEDLELAVSQPREDSVYPEQGDPGVDALHYDLDLTWDPETDTLTGTEVLTFRAAETDDTFQLDFGEPLEIEEVTLDGEPVEVQRDGKDLVVDAPVEEDQRYRLLIGYSGTPEPTEGPVSRPDLATLGFHIDDEHETWTIQEPYGAFTWYAVNDQPADKALYDFTLRVPSPWIGIANGEQTGVTEQGGTTTSTYHLAEPASSYLVTLAFGDYDKTEDTSASGVPLTYWIPQETPQYLAGPQTSPEAIAWLEEYLGPYPFDTGGILVAETDAGMETQTLITLGDNPYATDPSTVVHEFAHQWYGDRVTPEDWRDVWMNEGMAMYLQLMWDAEQQGVDITTVLDSYVDAEAEERAAAGPPGDYDPTQFGSSNIYFGPAFMWHEIRERLGDEEFFRLVRGWPESQDNKSVGRDDLFAYWNSESGQDLTPLFEDWLLSPTTPDRGQ